MPESTFFFWGGGGFQPPKFFVLGLCFLFVGKMQTQRISKGGDGGAENIFVLDLFGRFFRLLQKGLSSKL